MEMKEQQMNTLIESSRLRLKLSSSNTNTEPDSAKNQNTPPMPLVALYEHIHTFCLNYQLEIARAQVEYLKETRWRGQLQSQYTYDPTPTLILNFWCGNSFNHGIWGFFDGFKFLLILGYFIF
jgi:hypothetical protein